MMQGLAEYPSQIRKLFKSKHITQDAVPVFVCLWGRSDGWAADNMSEYE